MGTYWIDLFETKQSYVHPRLTDIQRRCPDNTLGIEAREKSTLHCYPRSYPKFSQKTRYSTVNRLSFPSSSLVPNFVKLINRDTSQVTRRMLKQPLSHVFHPQSEALCLYVLTLSQNQNISKNIYLTALLKNFRQRQNYISATAYILLLCWRILDHVKTRHQEQHIAYCFVEEL